MADRRQFLAALGSGVAGFSCLTATAQEKGAALPVAKRVVASDDYYGTTVLDPYRWMENANDPELVAWLKAQNARTRALLGKTPGSAAMRKRVSALSGELSVTRKVRAADSRLFFEQLPAGGDILALIGVVFVVLLILELVGVIDIFKKQN